MQTKKEKVYVTTLWQRPGVQTGPMVCSRDEFLSVDSKEAFESTADMVTRMQKPPQSLHPTRNNALCLSDDTWKRHKTYYITQLKAAFLQGPATQLCSPPLDPVN